MVLMLEDDSERIERFAKALGELSPNLALQVWNDAHSMIREAGPLLPSTTLISLDHDLVAEPGCVDPGDGYMVAQWLASQSVIRPVIIHSSNSDRATWMCGAFELAGWKYWRVAPIGEDWIEADWSQAVRRILRKAQRTQS